MAKQAGAAAAPAELADYTKVLQQIYVGYFGRPADPAGLVYYADMLRSVGAPTTLLELSQSYNSNPTLKNIIDGFGFSQESRELYPGDDASFVNAVYVNMFNRAPDEAGKSYWTGMISSGAITRANAALSIMAGARNSDISIVENKAAVAAKFTASLDSPSRLSSYNGNNASDMARTMLRKVGQSTAADTFQSDIDSAVNAMVTSNATPPRTMLAAAGHSMALKPDGSLWIWGNNYDGELGDPAFTSKSEPYKLGDGYTAIESGFNHSFALKADGSLYGWGWNLLGQLGPGPTKVSTPQKIGTGYSAISASYGHTLAIKFDRSLWAWGWNLNGQLGNGNRNDSSVPVRIGDGFSAVAAGFSHSLALKTDGSLWAWGSGNAGQLGDGTYTDSAVPRQIGTGFVAISAGTEFSVALKADGSLWAWGLNSMGQLGDGTLENRNRPVQIGVGYSVVSAGASHTLALKADGSLYSWGSNKDAQLGDPSLSVGKAPNLVGTRYVAIAAGEHHSLGIKADGSLWSWGRNDFGQLGNGRVTSETLPTLAADAVGDTSPPVPAVPSAKAAITSVTPLSAVEGQQTTFAVRGTNLSDDVKFSLEACLSSMSQLNGSGNSAERTFVCTPGVVGTRSGTIKSAATGETLFNFSVNVGGRPAFLSYSPLAAKVNQPTTFTIRGVYLPDGMVFSMDGCAGAMELTGGTASSRQFRCTPSSTGEKSGSLKTADGINLGKLNVTVEAATSTPDPQPTAVSTISGVVSFAPVSGATVSVYAVSSGIKGSLLGTATTNSSGEYTVQLGSYTGLVLLEAQGGRYTDPATGASKTLSLLRSVATVANGKNVANLTPFTEPVVANATKLSGGLSSANVASTLLTVKTQLGFDPVTTMPADPNRVVPASTSTSSVAYAGLLGAASQYAGDNQEKTISSIQEDLSALLAALAKVNPMIAQSADNYWANARNVMGLSSNLGSGNNFTICYTATSMDVIQITTCTRTKPVVTCIGGKTPQDGVCVKDTSTPTQPGAGTYDGSGKGTGKNAAQCISVSTRLKDGKNYYVSTQVMKNTCSMQIAVMMCHSPSSENGTAGSVCGARKGHYYTQQFWLAPGEAYGNPTTMPVGTTIYYGACSGGKGSQPSIEDIGTTGSYTCI